MSTDYNNMNEGEQNPPQRHESAQDAFDTAATTAGNKNNNNTQQNQQSLGEAKEPQRNRGTSFAAEFAKRTRANTTSRANDDTDDLTKNLVGSGAASGGKGGDEPLNKVNGASSVPRTKALHTHHYSEAELKKMKNFESVETWEPVTDLYLEHITESGTTDNRYVAWLIYCLVGIAIGF